MSPTTVGILAVGMSVDAMIAGLSRGAKERYAIRAAIGAGLVFGIVEMITPLIGWILGVLASGYVQAIDHWIAFGLLGAIGIKMILESFRPRHDAQQPHSFWALIATAVGTSIDAMAVGVSLAFLDVNIILVACAIGVATTVMATAGMLAGRYIGVKLGRIAEFLGGIALMGIGLSILIEHLSAV